MDPTNDQYYRIDFLLLLATHDNNDEYYNNEQPVRR